MKPSLLGLALVLTLVSMPSAAFAQSTAHGKDVFLANNCYLCHGTVGQGGAGPAIAPPKLMPTYAAFSAWVRHTGPGVMPAYTAKALADDDLAAIYAYLQSLKPPSGVPAELNALSKK